MTKFGKIDIKNQIVVIAFIAFALTTGFLIWFFNNQNEITTFEECEKTVFQISIVSPSVRECSTPPTFFGLIKGKTFRKIVIPLPGYQLEAIKEFRIILDNYRKIKRKAYDVNFEIIDKQILPVNFSFYQETTGKPVVGKYVSVHRDDECFDWQTKEYEVNIETNEVVSMRPVEQTSCWFPSTGDRLYKEITDEQGNGRIAIVGWAYDNLAKPPLSDEELKQTAIDFLTELLGSAQFKKIESSFDFRYDSNYDNYWGEYFFRWQDNNYTPPKGCAILMPPFIRVGITKSGHIFSYENTTSFFEDLPSNCKTPQVELIPTDFFIPFFNEEGKIEFKAQEDQIELLGGWYSHRISDSFILLTRQKELPDIGGTELYAYGEQIGIDVIPIDVIPIDISPEAWVAQKIHIDLDDVLVLESEWSTYYGQTLLIVESEAGGASGKQYTQYLFADGLVYIVWLYPLETYNTSSKTYDRNTLAINDARRALFRLLPHILAQESVQRQLAENCARDIPREKIDDTSLDSENKVVQFSWWDNEIEDNISLIVPYKPETDFAGCSESVKALLLHIQETYEDR